MFVTAGCYIFKGASKITRDNYFSHEIIFQKPAAYSSMLQIKITLQQGEYIIVPYPRTTSYGSTISTQLSVCCKDEFAIQLEPSPETKEHFSVKGFMTQQLQGIWHGITSGGSPECSGFFNNPQFLVIAKNKTKIQFVLEKTSKHWMPMGLYIVRCAHDRRIQKADFNRSGAVVGKINFTTGSTTLIRTKLTLLPGFYTVIAASKVEGRGGDFMLTVKSDKIVEFSQHASPQYPQFTFAGGFLGGKTSLLINEKFFSRNPTFLVHVKEDTHVVFDVSPLQERKMAEYPSKFSSSFSMHVQRVNTDRRYKICIYVFKPDALLKEENLVLTSGIGNWKNICCSTVLKHSSKPYQVVLGCNENIEAEYVFTLYSQKPVECTKSKNVYEYFNSSDFISYDFPGEWSGLHSGGAPNNKYFLNNPQYSLEIKELTRVEIKLRRENTRALVQFGFCVVHNQAAIGEKIPDEDILISTSNKLEAYKSDLTLKYVFQPKDSPYVIVPYTVSPGSTCHYTLTVYVSSASAVVFPSKSHIHTVSCKGSWNSKARSGGYYDSETFKNNPQWMIRIDNPVDIAFELEQNLLPITVSSELKTSSEMRKEDITEKFLDILGVKEHSGSKYDVKYPNICIFIIHLPENPEIEDLRKFTSKIELKHVAAQSGWKFHSRANVVVTLQPSPSPYFIVPSTLSEGYFNRFMLKTTSSLPVTVLPIEGTVVEEFEVTSEFKQCHISGSWKGFKAGGNPYRYDTWINNPVYLLVIKRETKAKITLLRKISKKFLMGFSIVQSKGGEFLAQDFKENYIFGESEMTNNPVVAWQDILKPSSLPYIIIPYSEKIGDEGDFEILIESDYAVTLSEPETKYSIVEVSHDGYWLGNVSTPITSTAFFKNQQCLLSVSVAQDVFIYLDYNVSNLDPLLYIVKNNEANNNKQLMFTNDYLQNNMIANQYSTFYYIPTKKSKGDFLLIPYLNSALQAEFKIRIYGTLSIGLSLKLSNSVSPFAYKDFSLDNTFVQKKFNIILEFVENKLLYPSLSLHITEETMLQVNIHNLTQYYYVPSVVYIVEQDKIDNLNNDYICKFEFLTFETVLKKKYVIQPGNYVIMVMPIKKIVSNILTTNQFSLMISLDYINSDNIVITHHNMTEIYDLPINEFSLKMPELENIVYNVILSQVKAIPIPIEAKSLCVFGSSAFPIMTASSLSGCTDLCDKRSSEICCSEHVGRVSREIITLFEPYIAASLCGKGKLMVVGSSKQFQKEHVATFDNLRILINSLKWLSKSPSASIVFYGAEVNFPTSQLSTLGFSIHSIERFENLIDVEFNTVDVIVLMLEKEVLHENIQTKLDRLLNDGIGILILCGNPNSSIRSLCARNGIVVCDRDVKCINEDEFLFSWINSEKLEEFVQAEAITLSNGSGQNFLTVKQNVNEFAHAGLCFMKMLSNSVSTKAELYQMYNILLSACLNIPIKDDRLLMPLLKKEYLSNNIHITSNHPLKCENIKEKLGCALNYNAWLNVSPLENSRFQLLFPAGNVYPGAVPDTEARKIDHTVLISSQFNNWFSTFMYAPATEVVKIIFRPELVNSNCFIQIGSNTDSLMYLHDKDWKRYPVITKSFEITKEEMNISSPFGGLIYLIISRQIHFQLDTEEKRKIIISGATECAHYVQGESSKENWLNEQRHKKTPVCEFYSKNIVITAPLQVAMTIEDPNVTLEAWSNIITQIESITGAPFRFPQRFCIDVQLFTDRSHSGSVNMFTTDFAEAIMSPHINDYDLYDDPGFHELTHNVFPERSFIWKGRSEPISAVMRAIVIEKLTKKKVDSLHYFNYHLAAFNVFIKTANMEKHQRYRTYRSHPFTIAIMAELILLAKFGSQVYIHVFQMYNNNKTKKDFSEQEKLDIWIVRFSQLVEQNIIPLYEACGLTISEQAQQALTKYSKFAIGD